MLLEALGSALLGLALAWAASHRLPHRLPSRALVLPTGVIGALFGAFVTHTSLGPGHVLATLGGSVVMAVALLSLLLRPTRGRARQQLTPYA
ncbi:hypothetical protein [Streptomyces sp. VRA16 Mangrove soil]|uniref:hypothetical protein n=1 Tax=Streptomyces sp. VRA16 Mangrove soil TaxID=2817434 RepID=UPI001A9E6409|nr:hypothetical protein [Streptomyces sp. VRA16 Mangrove soil]MBO1337062.1 hypothetical protein [Streptomyces sp. VRA16 Mangrove soil]